MAVLSTRPNSLLLEPERHPLRAAEFARSLGSVVVVAPHPDDESLGCGGILALLAETGRGPHIITMTDGSRSHPGSTAYPATRLAALREGETLAALAALGLPPENASFLRYPDCGLPDEKTTAFQIAIERLHSLLIRLAPETIFVPWRRDPHCDHVATWQLLRAAVHTLPAPPRWLEYPVWAWTKTASAVAPQAHEAKAWRIDISSVLVRKGKAVAQHRSQLGAVITDDPGGFVLSAEMLACFARPWELFLEPTHG